MTTYTLLLPDDAATAGAERVGGKAAGLARLHALGGNVPPWRALPIESFAAHWAANRLGPDATVEAILATRAEAALVDVIAAALQDIGPGPFAVRSSMVGEDSGSHSFAGQLESFLFQRDASEVAQSVVRCWASAFAPRVLAYRERAGLTGAPRVGVVIQRMIDGEVSGVVFTAHPVSGRRDHSLITAAWGLGEGIVSGLCDTDEFVWDRADGEVHARIAPDKHVAVRAAPDGGAGTVEVPVPEAQRGVRCLGDDLLSTVAAECLRVADALGSPQDIEYTFAEDRLYLLQARPITSLPTPDNTDGPRLVFDNSNIQESYCGVTTPLTFSFASAAYAGVYRQTMRAMSLPEAVIAEHEPMLRNLLGLIKGRVYYNIRNWYRGLLLLPSFGRNKGDMEAMMGLTDPVDFIEDEVLSTGDKLRRLPRMLLTLVRLIRAFRRLERAVPAWLAAFERSYERVSRDRLAGATFSELMQLLEQLDQEMLGNWHTPIINDFYVMMATGRLRRVAETAVGVEAAVPLVSALMSGEEGIESTEPVRELMRMAHEAGDDEALRLALKAGSPGEALAAIRERHPTFAARVDRYLERYGDRCAGELKLETISLREDPGFIIQVLRNYVDHRELDPAALAARERGRRAEAETTLRGALGPVARLRVGGVLDRARGSVRNREAMRLARTRMFGLYRDIYLRLGHHLAAAGRLDEPRDIFYVTTDEVDAYHEGRAVTATALGAVARARKAEYDAYEREPVPHQFDTRGPVYHGNRFLGPDAGRQIDADATTLRGIGCYPGVVEARARVILSPDEEEDLSVDGQILTTMRTDPGWAPLFPTCGGLLIERGSTLSHSAVIARELGIPAVVGVRDLLAIVRDGERLRLDGAAGVVKRLDVDASEADGTATDTPEPESGA